MQDMSLQLKDERKVIVGKWRDIKAQSFQPSVPDCSASLHHESLEFFLNTCNHRMVTKIDLFDFAVKGSI